MKQKKKMNNRVFEMLTEVEYFMYPLSPSALIHRPPTSMHLHLYTEFLIIFFVLTLLVNHNSRILLNVMASIVT